MCVCVCVYDVCVVYGGSWRPCMDVVCVCVYVCVCVNMYVQVYVYVYVYVRVRDCRFSGWMCT